MGGRGQGFLLSWLAVIGEGNPCPYVAVSFPKYLSLRGQAPPLLYLQNRICYYTYNYKIHRRSRESCPFPESDREHASAAESASRLARSGYPSRVCTEPVKYTFQLRYRLSERVLFERRGNRVEPRMVLWPFRPKGMKRFFCFIRRFLACLSKQN
jgi:hypothetical protein